MTGENVDKFPNSSAHKQLFKDDASQTECLELMAEKAGYDIETIQTKSVKTLNFFFVQTFKKREKKSQLSNDSRDQIVSASSTVLEYHRGQVLYCEPNQ